MNDQNKKFESVVINDLGVVECRVSTRRELPDGRFIANVTPIDHPKADLIRRGNPTASGKDEWVPEAGTTAPFRLKFVAVYKVEDMTQRGTPRKGATPHRRYVEATFDRQVDDDTADALAKI